jgi:broad specificity phosphatase PhoE
VIDELLLVRHGETVHNVAGIAQGWNDSALSERGQQQVEALARRLAAMHPDALFSSPLQRALTTAEAIARAIGLTITPLDDLREMNYGGWEGQSFLDVRRNEAELYRRWIEDANVPCPNGESHNELRRRLENAFATIASQASRAVVVTHGTSLRVAATILIDAPVTAARHFAQDNAALNIFVRRGDRMVMKLWNDASHLERGTVKDER